MEGGRTPVKCQRSHSKIRHGTRKAATGEPAGRRGASIAPPEYGLDFVDASATDHAQRDAAPERCSCSEKLEPPVSRCGCALCTPRKRPPTGTSPILDETQGARQAPPDGLRHWQPYNGGAATIVCDGSGGYGVDLGGWAGAPCGIEDCVRRHEESHARDWARRWPNGCKNSDGSNKPAGAQIPLGGPGYAAFLRQSECDAYTVEEGCIAPLLAAARGGCRTRLRAHQTDTQNQKASYC